MEAFLRALAGTLPGPLRGIATPVVDRLIGVWDWSRSLAVRVRGGWRRTATGVRLLRDGLEHLGAQSYATLRWLVTERVPALAGAARDGAIRWASDRLADVLADMADVRALAVRIGSGLLTDVLSRLDTLRRAVMAILAPLSDVLARLRERVYGTWGTPARLAAWLAGAMWSALVAHAASNLDALAESLWARRQRLILRGLAELERIIGRLL